LDFFLVWHRSADEQIRAYNRVIVDFEMKLFLCAITVAGSVVGIIVAVHCHSASCLFCHVILEIIVYQRG
jgi:hypothetical protein